MVKLLVFLLCLNFKMLYANDLTSNYENNMSETQILRMYLKEVKKSSKLEIEKEVGKLKFMKDVFKEESKRWWANYNKNVLKLKIIEYYGNYFLGVNAANRLKNSSDNYCSLIPTLISNKNKEGMNRGIKATVPECFIKGIFDKLKRSNRSITLLEKLIFKVEKKIKYTGLSEADKTEYIDRLKNDLKRVIKEQLTKYTPVLQESVSLTYKDIAKTKDTIYQLSQFIDCSNLTSENSIRYNCGIKIIKNSEKITINDSYKIVFGYEPLSLFMDNITIMETTVAINEYLATHITRKYEALLIEDLFHELNVLRNDIEQKKENANHLVKNILKEEIDKSILKEIDYFKSYIGEKDRDTIIENLFAIQQELKTFNILENNSLAQMKIIAKLIDRYNELVNRATLMSFNAPFGKTVSLSIVLSDKTKTIIKTNIDLPFNLKGYLFGRNEDDMIFWNKMLTINKKEK